MTIGKQKRNNRVQSMSLAERIEQKFRNYPEKAKMLVERLQILKNGKVNRDRTYGKNEENFTDIYFLYDGSELRIDQSDAYAD